jgi:cytosine/adenosine deaminase-related metal-dependent hydrolase
MSGRRTLLSGGILVTGERDRGVVWPGDLLIEDGKIAAIGPRIEVGEADVVDVSDRLVLPGFVDTHRHLWQSALRNIAADWTLRDYFRGVLAALAPTFRPEDIYAGNLLGALEALDAGVTTLLDWSHNLATPEHADAAIAGLHDANLRAVFAHGGGPQQWASLPSDVPHSDDVRRIRKQYFSADTGLVTMAIALRGPQYATVEATREDFAVADELGLRITMHVGEGEFGLGRPIETLARNGLLSDQVTYIHCNVLADDELRMIGDSGGTASVAPDVEMQMGHGWPATGRLLAAGVRPSLSSDIPTSTGINMFATMRTAIGVQRAMDNAPAVQAGSPVVELRVSCRDVLEFATIEGAHACGLDAVTGSLTVGKQADIVVLAASTLGLTPMNNPFGAVVYSGHPGMVEDVLVAGAWRKRHGRLVDTDLRRARELATASRDHVFAACADARIGGDWIPSRS